MQDNTNDDSYTSTPIAPGIAVHHEKRPDSLTVIIRTAPKAAVDDLGTDLTAGDFAAHSDPDTWEPLYRRDGAPRDYFETQVHLEIANKIEEKCPDYLNEKLVAETFREFCQKCAATYDKKDTLPNVVDDILNRTTAVKYRSVGNDTEIIVELSNGEKRGEITFTAGDWISDSPYDLIVGWFTIFHEKIELDGESWGYIRDEWAKQHEDVGGDTTSEFETAGELCMNKLRSTIDPYADRKALGLAEHNAWFEDNPSRRMTSIRGSIDAVLWVRSTAISHAIEETAKSHNDIPDLINHLEDEDEIVVQKKKIDDYRVYGFDPASMNVTPETLRDSDEDDDPSKGTTL